MITCSEGLSESTFVVEHQTTSQTLIDRSNSMGYNSKARGLSD